MERPVILVTGADGMLASLLIARLLEEGYAVHALSRRLRTNRTQHPHLTFFHWDYEAGRFEAACLDGVVGLIHLAGESIGTQAWTDTRKQAIRSSRVDTLAWLFQQIQVYSAPGNAGKGTIKDTLRVVIAASATGYYPDSRDRILVEESAPDSGFLGQTCVAWEAVLREGAERLGLRWVAMRSGVILSKRGGVYAQLRPLVRRGLGVIFGAGRQFLPWIHERDAADAYLFALGHPQMQGAFNLASPDTLTLSHFMRQFARTVGSDIYLPNVPGFMVRWGMGQRSELLLSSMRVSVSKLKGAGFEFRYERLDEALRNLEGA